MGRPKMFSSRRILMWKNHGWTHKKVANKVGCSLATVAAIVGRDHKLMVQKTQMDELWGSQIVRTFGKTPKQEPSIPKHEDYFIF